MPTKERLKLEISSDGKNLKVPPCREEIEISVIGPGYGECVILHLGDNNWFVVDSCIDPLSRKPAALSYFSQLEIDPKYHVRQVIATHWHDDHIRGFSNTLQVCSSSELVFSAALTSQEFSKLIYAFMPGSMIDSSGLHEFGKVLEILKERKMRGEINSIPILAAPNRLIWKGDVSCMGGAKCEIISLSPSDAAMLASKLDFGKLLPSMKEPKRWLPPISPNRAAVVLWLAIGDLSILLGADLEEDLNPQTGWSVIINSNARPSGNAWFFKIPHHGSETAHHEEVWGKMLIPDPIVVLTPFQKGRVRLPTTRDVKRIRGLTKWAFMAGGELRKPVKRDRTVEKTIQESVKDIRQAFGPIGHVRIRLKASDAPRVELFGEAKFLASTLNKVRSLES
jgi:hypothetical protein